MDAGLYIEHHHAIEKMIAQMSRALHFNEADADDFMQDARVYLLEKGAAIDSNFHGESLYETYLHRVLWNFGLNWRRGRVRAAHRFVTVDPTDIEQVVTTQNRADMNVRHAEVARLLRQERRELDRVLDGLSHRDFLLLAAWLSGDDLGWHATILCTTREALHSRIYRLLHALQGAVVEVRTSAPASPSRGHGSRLRRLLELVESPVVGTSAGGE